MQKILACVSQKQKKERKQKRQDIPCFPLDWCFRYKLQCVRQQRALTIEGFKVRQAHAGGADQCADTAPTEELPQ